jgi:hypothetical protein
MLSEEQRVGFRASGFVLLAGLVPAAALAAWRAQFWAHHRAAGADPADPASWRQIGGAQASVAGAGVRLLRTRSVIFVSTPELYYIRNSLYKPSHQGGMKM